MPNILHLRTLSVGNYLSEENNHINILLYHDSQQVKLFPVCLRLKAIEISNSKVQWELYGMRLKDIHY